MTAKEATRQEAIVMLREHLKPGDTVSTILRHVSRSGMSRSICPVIQTPEGLWTPWGAVGNALGWTLDRDRGGVKVSGCGMDMGFHLVYALSATLFRDGFGCIGKGCPSNDHSNGDRDYTPHEDHATSPEHICAKSPETCAAHKHWHRDGGYALRTRWL